LSKLSGLSKNRPSLKRFPSGPKPKINELKDQRIKKLEEKLIHKNEVIAELREENVKAKKPMGTFRRSFPMKSYRPTMSETKLSTT
jgi:hypothetical protein